MEFIIKIINPISHLLHFHILIKAFLTARKNVGMWVHYTDLAAISDLRILKSLKEAYTGEERI